MTWVEKKPLLRPDWAKQARKRETVREKRITNNFRGKNKSFPSEEGKVLRIPGRKKLEAESSQKVKELPICAHRNYSNLSPTSAPPTAYSISNTSAELVGKKKLARSYSKSSLSSLPRSVARRKIPSGRRDPADVCRLENSAKGLKLPLCLAFVVTLSQFMLIRENVCLLSFPSASFAIQTRGNSLALSRV